MPLPGKYRRRYCQNTFQALIHVTHSFVNSSIWVGEMTLPPAKAAAACRDILGLTTADAECLF
jgi:hypothetical protein